MSETHDFERTWLAKFSSSLDAIAGEEIRDAVMLGSKDLSSQPETLTWPTACSRSNSNRS